jgi:hypothetical protein
MNSSTRQHIYLALLLAIVTSGTWCNTDTLSTYSENLAVHRKQFKVVKSVVKKPGQISCKKKTTHICPTHAITDQLDYLLARKKAVSEHAKYVQGHTIQVYTGSSRKEAFKIRNDLYTYYPAIVPEIVYEAPNYTVRLGKFLDTLEAYPTYAAIRKRIPQAIIRPVYFMNQPKVLIGKQLEDQSDAAPSVSATDTYLQNKQK